MVLQEENKRQKKEKGRQKSFQRSNSAKHAAASGSPSKHSGGGDVHMGQEGVVSANTNSSGDGRAQREGFDFCNVASPTVVFMSLQDSFFSKLLTQ